MDGLKPHLATLARGETLSRAEAEAAFDHLLAGVASPAQVAGLLMGMRARGETIDEIAGAVAAMRARMLRVAAPPGAIDIVGTGGDGHGTFNVSTLAAIIVAACGVPVAKHGNRASSSRSGSSDVLAALGVAIDCDVPTLERCLTDVGLCFMSAQAHHAAMRQVAAIRAELGVRTIFNLLGPLANPAGVDRLLVGVFAPGWLEPLARVLGALGAKRAWLVHGADGLDEISTTGDTQVVSWQDGTIERFNITPESVGLPRVGIADLKGGDAATNAVALRDVLAGRRGPYRDIACYNAGAGLLLAGAARDLADGVALAQDALDGGRAGAVLDRLVAVSNGRVPVSPTRAMPAPLDAG